MLYKNPHFLIIDDDEINNFIAQMLINKMPPFANVSTCLNGQIGINFLISNLAQPQNLPDIILLDINMPVMNGWQFLEEYQKTILPFLNKKIIINIVSSSVSDTDITKSKSYSFVNKFISKPLTTQIVDAIFADI
ncbi:MAG: response regulator [Sphingobacteriales bacterium]|nr:MAG: response regulator [Sphingobacteriales bacterium]TAF82838.1 MAG: response regulator [Sphingobacteriales bacterium]